jgi:protein phosphatase
MKLDPRRVKTASLSDVGRVRTGNEDYCGEFENGEGMRLLVVADGMGGHQGGATASRMAVEAIGEVFRSAQGEPETVLQEAFDAANGRVFQMAQERAELRGMGTTGVSLLLGREGVGWVAHVGDSRAYRFREGKLEPLTADHSVVAEMQRRGLIDEQQAAVHPRRNEILRSIGVEPVVSLDLRKIELAPGDRYVLCTDGLSGLVSDEEIAAVVARESPGQAVRTLIDTANSRGGVDNVTVQVAAVPDGQNTETGARQSDRTLEVRSLAGDGGGRRRIRRVAALTALVAGLLAAALLWLVFGTNVLDAGPPR